MSGQVFNGQQTFMDLNGDPLAGGSVFFYVPGTTTPKTTWVDSGFTVANVNPIILDQAGRATIWGQGAYRQVVVDQFGNTQWDQVTDAGFSTTLTTLTVNGTTTLNGATTVNGLLSAFDGAQVTGGVAVDSLTATNDVNVDGKLTVSASGSKFSNGLVVGSSGGVGTTALEVDSGSIVCTGDRIISSGDSTPSVVCYNTTSPGFTGGMASAGGQLYFGQFNNDGSPDTKLIVLDPGGSLWPETNNSANSGLTANAWASVFSYAYVTATSSAANKSDITNVIGVECLDLVSRIDPVTFKYRNPSKDDSNRTHWGFISEDVMKAAKDLGISLDAFYHNPDDNTYGMAYQELIAVLWGALKSTNNRMAALQDQINELVKGQVEQDESG